METKQKSILYKYIDKLCIDRDTNIAELARKLGKAPANFYQRLNNGKMSFEELTEIANVLGYTFNYNFQPMQDKDDKVE